MDIISKLGCKLLFSQGDNLYLKDATNLFVVDDFYLNFNDLYGFKGSKKAHTAYLANLTYSTDFANLISIPSLSEVTNYNQILSLGSTAVSFKQKGKKDFEYFNNIFTRVQLPMTLFYSVPLNLVFVYAVTKDNNKFNFFVKSIF